MKRSLVFGGKCTDSLANLDPNPKSLSWRTSQTSFEWADPTLLVVLPASGMTANGRLYPLHKPEHPILDAGGLPSPSQLPSDTICATSLRLPTPTCHDIKNNMSPSCWKRQGDLGVEMAKLDGFTMETITGELRILPAFVEWMMGFPKDWTDSRLLETQSSHSAQSGSDNKL